MSEAALPLLLVGLAVALGALLWKTRRDNLRLRRAIDKSSRDLQNLQVSFSRFAPDEVIERIISDGVSGVGEHKDVTVLFADLVGFTALSQRLEPPQLLRILNEYFDRMSAAVSDHRGYVSTFLGDGILALFGALHPNPWQVNDAAKAALAMHASLNEFNRELDGAGFPELQVGIGLEYGRGVAGLVGSRDLKEFTVVGRTVNVAARIQELTRQFEPDIILTHAVRDKLDPSIPLVELPPTKVKGVEEAVAIYGLLPPP